MQIRKWMLIPIAGVIVAVIAVGARAAVEPVLSSGNLADGYSALKQVTVQLGIRRPRN